jgi:ABC-type transporter Mla maintaining outer membrane lipid asymmetry ATPase subunit MlaF
MAAADGMTAHVLQLNDVRLRRGEREVLAGVSFGVPRGEIVALMGLQVPARLRC